MNTTPTTETDAFISASYIVMPRTESEWKDFARKLERERDKYKGDAEAWNRSYHEAKRERDEARKENNILRLLVAKAGKSCHYCGLTNMAECKSGFPGCALADDLMVGEDEFVLLMRKERDQLRAELTKANDLIASLRRDLADPPGDVQELVINKLNLVSADDLAAFKAVAETLHHALGNTLEVCSFSDTTSREAIEAYTALLAGKKEQQ